jgi:serine/threonine protein phosphatase PrpC
VWREASDRGLRDDNQDHAISISPNEAELIRRKGVLLVVCDGVGTELGGKRAAEVAADTTLDAYYDDESIDPQRALQAAIGKAHATVVAEARQLRMPNMATTIVAGVVQKNRLYVAHVGDSRAYLLRDGRLARITKDHTSLSDAISEGTLTREETRKVSKRRAITRSLGTASATPDVAVRELHWGDRVLLCSDGLYDAVDEPQIERILGQHLTPERAVSALVRAALSNNTSDNVSVSVLNYGESAKAAGALPFPVRWVVAGVAALLALGLIGFGLQRIISSLAAAQEATVLAEIATAAPLEPTATALPDNKNTQASNASSGVKPDVPTETPLAVVVVGNEATPEPAATQGPAVTPTLARPPTATTAPASRGPQPTRRTGNAAPGGTPSTNTDQVFGPNRLVSNGVSVFANERFGMELLSTGYERWGDPQASSQCDGYYDLRPVHQFKLTVRVTNTGTDTLTGLKSQFFTSNGVPLVACHDGGGPLPTIPPGESRVVRLLAYLHEGQDAAAITLSAASRSERACFVNNKLARC